MVRYSFQAQMMGQAAADERQRHDHPAAARLRLDHRALPGPDDHACASSPKRSARGTIELLLTSPVKDIEIIIGKWLGAVLLYLCVLGCR